jgi:hypothetical protein
VGVTVVEEVDVLVAERYAKQTPDYPALEKVADTMLERAAKCLAAHALTIARVPLRFSVVATQVARVGTLNATLLKPIAVYCTATKRMLIPNHVAVLRF